jgi:hypothetical protein
MLGSMIALTGLGKYIPLNHPILGANPRCAGKSGARGLPFVARDLGLPQLMGFSLFSTGPIWMEWVQERWH